MGRELTKDNKWGESSLGNNNNTMSGEKGYRGKQNG